MQSVVRQSFARGMLLEMSDNVAPPDAVRYVNNMIPRPLGAMTTRWGRQRRYGIDPASSVVRTLDLFRYRASTGDWYDVFVNERASDNAIGYVGSGGWTNIATGLTKGGTTVAMQVRDRLLLANGSDAVKCYVYASSTHTVRNVGPGSGPAATAGSPSSGGSLSLATTYNWRVTALLGSDGETNPGTVSADRTTSTGNQTVAVSWSALTPPAGMTVSGYRIWRRATGVWNTWYLVAQVGSGVTSYSDTKADTDVYAAGGGTKLATNLGAPPTGSTGVAWWDYESRSIAWVGSTLYLSEINKPEVFKTADDEYDGTNVRQFFDLSGNNPANPILAVRPYDRYLYVFCQFGVRIITATDDPGPALHRFDRRGIFGSWRDGPALGRGHGHRRPVLPVADRAAHAARARGRVNRSGLES